MKFTDQFSQLSFPLMGLVRFPTVTISPEDRKTLRLKPNVSNREILRQLAWAGYLAREARGKFVGISREQVIAQFKTEFATFDKTGVIPYLLLIWDVNYWSDKQGIVRGFGRGSAGGSLTNFCLGITDVNPLHHNLDFPRFISEARMKPIVKDGVTYIDGKSAPDIDVDYQYLRRADVVKYVETKYAGHTCKISTRMELTGKMALKDTLKVYAGYTEDAAKQVSGFIEARFGKVQTLHEAKEKNEDIQKWLKINPTNARIYEIAMAIEGAPVGKGQHPSGVFISYAPLEGSIPIELSKDKEVVTSFDMETVSGLGIKADILGLRTLDLVAGAAALAGIKVEDIDVNDPIIYDYLQTKSTFVGLFQIEEGTTKDAVQQVGPRNIEDLIACVAISRPGAYKNLPTYVAYVRRGELKSIHPAIDAVLKETGNVLIYQEQITAICRDVFGMSGIDADQVRYAVSKKKKEEMAKWESVLREQGKKKSIPDSVIQYFWDVCNASADYLFVRAHSCEYSYLTAACVYLKAKAPQAFYLWMLKLASEEPDSVTYMNGVISEMRSTGIQLLPPDLLKSEADFTIQDGHIRFGLSSIKGISSTTMSKITSFKCDFSSKFAIFEAAKSAKINIAALGGLIYCGCLDSVITNTSSRAKLALEAQLYNLLTDNEKVLAKRYGPEYQYDVLELLRGIASKTNEKGKPLVRESRMGTIRRDYAPFWDQFLANSKNEELCCYIMERHLLGFSYTSTLHNVFSRKVVGLVKVSDLPQLGRDRKNPVRFVAFVEEGKLALSKKDSTPYWKADCYDDWGRVKIMLHNEEKLDACRSFNGDLPKTGDIVICSGTLSDDGGIFFAHSVLVQPNPIKTKKSADVEI